jgi:hypothetical protein
VTAVDDAPRNPGGRPSKLTDERAEAILTAVEQGSYLKVAALASGVSETTLHRWLANGVDAQRILDAHDPDRRYCPRCDREPPRGPRPRTLPPLPQHRRPDPVRAAP